MAKQQILVLAKVVSAPTHNPENIGVPRRYKLEPRGEVKLDRALPSKRVSRRAE